MLTKGIRKLITPWNLLILIILLLAFILRIYRIETLLDFHYDQGRDAQVIWNLWQNKKLFLIGPVTGLDGVFLGPFYYYLIAPFYLIGGGNPVIPSLFLSVITVTALYFLYKTGELLIDKKFGLLVLLIGSFSNYIIFSNRWLSNPTPIYLTSILIFYYMLKVVKEKKIKLTYWYLIFLFVGLSFHFEAASAFFYLPVLAVFTFWMRRKISIRTLLISGVILFLTFLPQLVFNLRHDNLIINNLIVQIQKVDENKSTLPRIILDRLKVLLGIFSVKIFPQKDYLSIIFGLLSIFGIYKNYFKNKNLTKLFLIFLGPPFIGYMLYRGNHGVLYDYYLTGYYLIIILLFAYGLWFFFSNKITKNIIYIFIVLFFIVNLPFTYRKLTSGVFDGNDIYLANQISAIEWIRDDAKTTPLNIDVYVPPVIPHSYNYLFRWLNLAQSEDNQKLLYTLYEIDPPHPERLGAWLDRQNGIGVVEKTATFGGVTVDRRTRNKYE